MRRVGEGGREERRRNKEGEREKERGEGSKKKGEGRRKENKGCRESNPTNMASLPAPKRKVLRQMPFNNHERVGPQSGGKW